jgi:hypothetical protein
MLARLLSCCGGFLLAVLWFDLMFDVQVLRYTAGGPLPEPVLASIAGYYRRVTADAYPMNRAVGLVMLIAIGGSIWQLRRAHRRGLALASLLLVAGPVALAALRVFPNAVQLGARTDTLVRQSELARTICTDHLWCVAAIAVFTVIQVLADPGFISRRARAPSTSIPGFNS